jgi:site-specific DNA recombinase
MSPKRAYSYIRVSTVRQEQRGFSIPAQESDNLAYCKQKGYHLIGTFTDVESGKDYERRDLSQIVDDAAQGSFDVLVIAEIDRLTRAELRQFLNFEHDLKQTGVSIEYARQPFLNTGQDGSGFYKNILALIAHDERDRIARRMYAGKRQKVKDGRYIASGKPPYGFEKKGTGRESELVVNEGQASIVRRIFQWYAHDQMPITHIAKRLTRERILTPGAVDKRDIARRIDPPYFWNPHKIYDILRCRAYTGEYENFQYKNVRIDGKTRQVRRPPEERVVTLCPSIISKETWDLAQRRRSKGRKRAFRNTKFDYLIARRIRCACGYAMTAFSSQADPQNPRLYYKCISRHRHIHGENPHCGAPYTRAHLVDEAVWTWVAAILQDPARLEEGYRQLIRTSADSRQNIEKQISDIDRQLDGLRGQLDRLLDLYAVGTYDLKSIEDKSEDLTNQVQGLEADRRQLLSTLDKPLPTPDHLKSIHAFAREISKNIDKLTFEDRRRIIDQLDLTAVLEYTPEKERLLHLTCRLFDLPLTHTLDITY